MDLMSLANSIDRSIRGAPILVLRICEVDYVHERLGRFGMFHMTDLDPQETLQITAVQTISATGLSSSQCPAVGAALRR